MAHPTITLNNGKKMPLIGLGTLSDYSTDERFKQANVVYEAIKCGYRHIDTALIYDTEEEVGKGVKQAIAEGICSREEVFITTKVWINNLRRERVLKQAEESNCKLGLGYIDLLLVHFPTAIRDPIEGEEVIRIPFPYIVFDKTGKPFSDPTVDIHQETWPAMEQVQAQGIARSIGVSNYNTKQIEDLMKVAKVTPVINQVECTPFLPQIKLKQVCAKHGIHLAAYCPLGGGARAGADGQVKTTDTSVKLRENVLINALGVKYNKTPQQIMLKFQVDRNIVVIAKSFNLDRVKQNQDIFDFKLTKEDIESLEKLSIGERNIAIEFMIGHPQYPFDQE